MIELPNPNREVIEQLNDYAVHLRNSGKYQTALVALHRALALDSLVPELWANLGCVYFNMGAFNDALEPMRKAVQLGPEKASHWGNLALLYGALRMYDEAHNTYKECVRRCQNRKDELGALWDQSLLWLEQGEWEKGLDQYDVRIELNGPPKYPKFPIPLWEGEPLDGKTLYIQSEQGIGDRILFSRYIAEIHRRWPTCRMKACLNEKMNDLFWEFRHMIDLLPHGVPWPDGLDYGVYMASLPRLLSRSPTEVPADPGLIRKRVEQQATLGTFNCPEPRGKAIKVGVAWTGNPEQIRNLDRTIPLAKMLGLAENPSVVLYSFQVGAGSEEIDKLDAGQLICPLGPDLEQVGLVSAGVAMMEMDLMITVCTSTAHLAGALGVPTWTLLCFDPYWVWMQGKEVRTDSVWYPNMRLFRQPTPGDWDSVLAEVKQELKTFCAVSLGAVTLTV